MNLKAEFSGGSGWTDEWKVGWMNGWMNRRVRGHSESEVTRLCRTWSVSVLVKRARGRGSDAVISECAPKP